MKKKNNKNNRKNNKKKKKKNNKKKLVDVSYFTKNADQLLRRSLDETKIETLNFIDLCCDRKPKFSSSIRSLAVVACVCVRLLSPNLHLYRY